MILDLFTCYLVLLAAYSEWLAYSAKDSFRTHSYIVVISVFCWNKHVGIPLLLALRSECAADYRPAGAYPKAAALERFLAKTHAHAMSHA